MQYNLVAKFQEQFVEVQQIIRDFQILMNSNKEKVSREIHILGMDVTDVKCTLLLDQDIIVVNLNVKMIMIYVKIVSINQIMSIIWRRFAKLKYRKNCKYFRVFQSGLLNRKQQLKKYSQAVFIDVDIYVFVSNILKLLELYCMFWIKLR